MIENLERYEKIISKLEDELVKAKVSHISIGHAIDKNNGRFVLIFSCIDSPRCHEVMDDIESRYCETLEPMKVTKTTRRYYI